MNNQIQLSIVHMPINDHAQSKVDRDRSILIKVKRWTIYKSR
jgi:hypothetical protein